MMEQETLRKSYKVYKMKIQKSKKRKLEKTAVEKL